MAAPFLRDLPFLCHRRHLHYCRLVAGSLTRRRPWCTFTESTPSDNTGAASSTTTNPIISVLSVGDPPKNLRLDDPDYHMWKDKEAETLDGIEPVISLAKDILHSNRYMDSERPTAEDERIVVQKLLPYHPHCEDKIGCSSCGLDLTMVDRHPQFKQSRWFFVVRTDGGWIDFSYQKCLRAYSRDKFPSHAERFIKEHLKWGRN